jgi:DNA-binding NtrC family response regulator
VGLKGAVLVVDDDASICGLVETALTTRDFSVRTFPSADGVIETASERTTDAVLVDVRLDGDDGLELCARIVDASGVPVVVMTGNGDLGTAIRAMRAGAYDFVTKPVDFELLELVLTRAVRHRRLALEVEHLRTSGGYREGTEMPLGTSPVMRRVRDLIARVAPTDASTLIVGESGTGKELVARALHRASRRHDGPFVAVSCAAIPDTLLESELFGHARGAFTDAREARVGMCQQADGGVLFLDEIGELPLKLQPKLLRALQERTVRPLGGSDEVPFDARVVAATNVDLTHAVADGRFRHDLFFRLAVIQIDVPPLRDRDGDVLPLAQTFLRRHAREGGKVVDGFTAAAAQRLLGHRWPGNVRELQNCIEHAVVVAEGRRLSVRDLPASVRAGHPRSRPTAAAGESLATLADVERAHVRRVLDAVGRNHQEAARVLGIDRKTLYRKLRRYAAGR